MLANQGLHQRWRQQLHHILLIEQDELHCCLQDVNPQALLCFSDLYLHVLKKMINTDHFWYYAPYMKVDASNKWVVGDYLNLPFLSDSMPSILIPHVLDAISEKKQCLKEIYRILQPEGHCFITGFNSDSLFGLPVPIKHEPAFSQLVSASELRKLLIRIGFNVIMVKSFYFQPAFLQNKMKQFSKILEMVGHLVWPMMGTLYLFYISKPVLGAKQVGVIQKTRKKLHPKGLVEPT
jgi:SAM-dependent methyltransferase